MVKITPFDKEHLAATYRWILDPELRKGFLFSRIVTPESHTEWYENLTSSRSERVFAIYCDNLHVGNLGLKHIDLANRSAESWIYIGDQTQKNKGISYDSYVTLIELLKSEKMLDLIYCHIAAFNGASIRLYEKLGFERDFEFQKQIIWMSESCDLLRYKKRL